MSWSATIASHRVASMSPSGVVLRATERYLMGTVPIAAGVVGRSGVAAGGAQVEVPAEDGCPAGLDGAHHFELLRRQCMALPIASSWGENLGRAEYLLAERWKDAAGVLSHRLSFGRTTPKASGEGRCTRKRWSDGDKPKKADRLNADLTKADVFSKIE